MRPIYSKIQPKVLLHIINKLDTTSERTDIIPSEEFLQLACLKMSKGKKFKPHKHIYKPGEETVIAQESWVVVSGRVKVFLYDLDDTILDVDILSPGDCSITLRGGHTYEILEEDTIVYEYKTGPYKGQESDKEFINES